MSGTGRVRPARLTDLPALGELSRLAQHETVDVRSLGLPVSGPRIGVFGLFRLPLGAFRAHDLLYVQEEAGRLGGLIRVECDSSRDDWTIVELDAVGFAEAGDIRFRLLHHVLREGARRGANRFHVACADASGNVALFMQAGFARYGEEILLYRRHDAPLPEPWTDERAAQHRIRPVTPTDAIPLSQLYAAVTPQPVQRLEAYRIGDWSRPAASCRVPRSSLSPILRLADVESWVCESSQGGSEGTIDALVQVGVAREDQPHYLKVLARPDVDAAPLVDFGLGLIRARTDRRGCADAGIIAPVRTYESPIDRRLEAAGFGVESTVALLLKETVVRVAEPSMVPAVR